MNNKKLIIIIAIIVLIVVVVFLVKSKDTTETTIKNNIATSDIEIDKVTFSDITKKYQNGITTLSAKIMNNTNDTRNFVVKITLKDDNGKIVQSLTQKVENLEPGKIKILSTGIIGDYSKINDICFEIVNN